MQWEMLSDPAERRPFAPSSALFAEVFEARFRPRNAKLTSSVFSAGPYAVLTAGASSERSSARPTAM